MTLRDIDQKPLPKMMPGVVCVQKVRCGKPNCKCAMGERHSAYYRFWREGGRLRKAYVRRADLEQIRVACARWKEADSMTAAGARVRFTAIGPIERMRLEVFDTSGQPVFDTGFKPGNVRDWRLVGTHGQLLPDSSYLCVVTIKDLSGKLSFRQGNVFVQSGQAALAMEGSGQPERIDTEESLSARNAAEPAAMTVVAYDGRDGQVVSTTGGLIGRTHLKFLK